MADDKLEIAIARAKKTLLRIRQNLPEENIYDEDEINESPNNKEVRFSLGMYLVNKYILTPTCTMHLHDFIIGPGKKLVNSHKHITLLNKVIEFPNAVSSIVFIQ